MRPGISSLSGNERHEINIPTVELGAMQETGITSFKSNLNITQMNHVTNYIYKLVQYTEHDK